MLSFRSMDPTCFTLPHRAGAVEFVTGTAYPMAMQGMGPAGRQQRAGIVLNNMIPALGVLFLGWEAGPVLFLLWLDGWLGVWEIGAAACAQAVRRERFALPPGVGSPWRQGFWTIAYLSVVAVASAPSALAWMGLLAVTGHRSSGALLGSVFAGSWVAAAAVLNILLRAAIGLAAAGRNQGRGAAFTLEEKYHLLAFKALAMFMLAPAAAGGGRSVLAGLVLLLSGLFSWAELQPGRVLHLLKAPGPPAG